MSFAFSFSNEDLSDDELDHSSNTSQVPVNTPKKHENPLDSILLVHESVSQPISVSLEELLSSLINVRLSFETFSTPLARAILYRRELFDVKHQLMSEIDSATDTNNIELEILMGETNEDLRRNIYEGGLKSWECSIDLVDSFIENPIRDFKCQCTIELGCGTALPTEYLFMDYLRSNSTAGINFTLCDYNQSVLRLVTLPNLIVAWAKTVLSQEQWTLLQNTNDPNVPVLENELLLTKELLHRFNEDLTARNIQLFFISGTWGRKFIDILVQQHLIPYPNTLILTSETIYQPDTLPIISETLIEIILSNKQAGNNAKTLLAAKDIYFGVGGSIIEFENYMNDRIQADNLPVTLKNFKVNAGLKRSIVYIELI